jgi:hypothetical protein
MSNNAESFDSKYQHPKRRAKISNFFEDCSYSNKKYKRLQELCCTALPVLCISASSRMMMGR